MMNSDSRSNKSKPYIPKIYVTRVVYDAIPPHERELYNYAVEINEKQLELPILFNIPSDANIHE